MRNIVTALLATTALAAFSSSALAECSYGHTKQVMASTVEDASTMSTHDSDIKLPVETAQTDDTAVVTVPDEGETTAE
ncbi:MAG TPA: hypothetical protein VKN63_05650 [Afifellaceae bacterium]|nr:hypothetical protein [Afifellaceae bacterium]